MTEPATTKTCGTCGQDKPLGEFGTRPNGKGGVYPHRHCRPCMNEAQRNNPRWKARRHERQRTARAQARDELAMSLEIDAFVPAAKPKGAAPLPTADELRSWYAAGCPL